MINVFLGNTFWKIYILPRYFSTEGNVNCREGGGGGGGLGGCLIGQKIKKICI